MTDPSDLYSVEATSQGNVLESRALSPDQKALFAEIEALKESESRFRQIAENVTEVFFIIDSQTDQILYISPTYETVWGRTCQSLYDDPESWLMAIHPDDCGQAIATLETQFRTGDEFQEEYRILRPDGSIRWIWSRAFPIRDERGKVHRFVGIAEDVTDRKLAEIALRESEEQFRLIFELAPIGMAVTDLDGNLMRVNGALCDLLRYTPLELLQRNLWKMLETSHQDLCLQMVYKLLHGQEDDIQLETQYVTLDNQLVDVIVKLVVVRQEDGSPVNINVQIVDITERKRMERQLRYDALHDGLTGLPNRTLLLDRLGQNLKRLQRNLDNSFGVLFLDLDRFKVINDSLGHAIGDRLLILIARRLETCVRPEDTVARLGGDEFVILLENIEFAEQAIQIAERIHHIVSQPYQIEGYEIFSTVSIGIAFGTQAYQQPEEILRDADLTMYQAKNKGKARYEIFDPSLHQVAMQRLELEQDLCKALEREEFTLYYQPITSLKTGELEGFEALVRWQHPQKGLIPPGKFIAIAEETGLIVPLGNWILLQACLKLQEWNQNYPEYRHLKMSVNLSGRQFAEPSFLTILDQILKQTGIDPSCLKLEITESILMEDVERATHLLHELRGRHLELSIDDFGTGYSSLSYLQKFPINTVKIDRSFVQSLCIGLEDHNLGIVKAIVTLAHILKLNVIAEGIETDHQLHQLRMLDCEQGQGYYFSHPLTVEDAEDLLQKIKLMRGVDL